MKPPVPEVGVTLDRERTLRFDFFAFREFKRLTREAGLGPEGQWGRPEGISLQNYAGPLSALLDEETLPIFLTSLLRHEDKEVGVEDVVELMTEENLVSLAESILQLLKEGLDLKEVGEPVEDSPDEGPPLTSSGQSGGTT